MNEHTSADVIKFRNDLFKLNVSGYLGEGTSNFVYFSAELPKSVLVELKDQLNTLLPTTTETTTGEVIHECGYLHPSGTPCPIVTNPMALNADALVGEGEDASLDNSAPAISQADGFAKHEAFVLGEDFPL